MPQDATDSVLDAALARAERAVVLRDPRGLKTRAVLKRQLGTLSRTLDRLLRAQLSSTEAQVSGAGAVVLVGLATRAVARAVALLNERLDIQSRHAVAAAATDAQVMVSGMEELMGNQVSFSRAALLQRMQSSGPVTTLLSVHRASAERYGAALTRKINNVVYAGLRDDLTQQAMVDRVSALLEQKRWWAERIVRTETARAYNAATEGAIGAYAAEGVPLGKKIIAFFDNRTAYDSVYVHGQVRAHGEYFIDGAGRQYLYPPGRPNDREVIIPWSTRWPEGSRTRAIPAREMPSPSRQRDIARPSLG